MRVSGLIEAGPVPVGGGITSLLLETLGSRVCVCVVRLCLECARLSCCSALVLRLRMALLLCFRVERVAAVSRFCVALLVCLEVRDCRAMGLSV